ncbi:endonuclease V [Amycolatopsis sp. MEPSY49]|uniref:endonuclease V n=1 Tax=Amycolatopsis sp. MEPSY49 TaxID=3151600 RepID=UPI003EF42395
MHTGDWPATVEEAPAVQERLRVLVDFTDDLPELPPTVTGLDVAYDAPAVISETRRATGRVRAGGTGEAGPVGFRESKQLSILPDRQCGVLVDEGHRVAHVLCSASASRAGLMPGWPAFGVVEPRTVDDLDARGRRAPSVDPVGRVQEGIKAGYLPAGQQIGVHAGYLTPRYRLPETTRRADRLSRAALR